MNDLKLPILPPGAYDEIDEVITHRRTLFCMRLMTMGINEAEEHAHMIGKLRYTMATGYDLVHGMDKGYGAMEVILIDGKLLAKVTTVVCPNCGEIHIGIDIPLIGSYCEAGTHQN